MLKLSQLTCLSTSNKLKRTKEILTTPTLKWSIAGSQKVASTWTQLSESAGKHRLKVFFNHIKGRTGTSPKKLSEVQLISMNKSAPSAKTKRALKKSYNKQPENIFESFDPKPLASASIA